ncbi:hypothetical protein [Streptomyces sp. NPDC023838]|uniref:hypothetical protein n=1 Tax=Streptomyces sp. NPDC023838 TaxID=3154325 RepID=UPI0033E625FA
MDGMGLSPQERLLLTEIEQELSQDGVLERRLRTMRRGFGPRLNLRAWTGGHRPALVAWLLCAASMGLFVPAVASSSTGLIWAFAAVWVLTLICVIRLVCRWCSRMASTHSDRQEDA